MKRQQRVTIEDVAREAGVSTMTVSRVINNTGRISEETRQHVRQIVERLGYRPNRAAQTLVTNRTQMVAFVVPDITNPYFSEIFQGVEDVLRQENYNVLVANGNEMPSREKEILTKLDDSTVDGLIICSSRLPDDELLPLLEKFPAVVSVTRPVPKHMASAVVASFETGFRSIKAIKYLYSVGYHNVGYIRLNHFDMFVTLEDVIHELEKDNIYLNPDWCDSCDPKWLAGYKAGRKLLEKNPPLDAIVGGNDLVTLGIMRAALELGYRIPEDLALVGADNILIASQVTPPLTTLAVDKYANGVNAAKLLLSRMAGDKTYREYVYDTELIIRGSSDNRVPV